MSSFTLALMASLSTGLAFLSFMILFTMAATFARSSTRLAVPVVVVVVLVATTSGLASVGMCTSYK